MCPFAFHFTNIHYCCPVTSNPNKIHFAGETPHSVGKIYWICNVFANFSTSLNSSDVLSFVPLSASNRPVVCCPTIAADSANAAIWAGQGGKKFDTLTGEPLTDFVGV